MVFTGQLGKAESKLGLIELGITATDAGGATVKTLASAVGTDTAQTLIAEKQPSLAISTETTTTQSLLTNKQLTVTPITTIDAAQTLSIKKQLTLTLAATADSAAQAISISKLIQTTSSTGTDITQQFAVSRAPPLISSIDTSQTQSLDKQKNVSVGVVNETDVTAPISFTDEEDIIPATTLDVVQSLSASKTIYNDISPTITVSAPIIDISLHKAVTIGAPDG